MPVLRRTILKRVVFVILAKTQLFKVFYFVTIVKQDQNKSNFRQILMNNPLIYMTKNLIKFV